MYGATEQEEINRLLGNDEEFTQTEEAILRAVLDLNVGVNNELDEEKYGSKDPEDPEIIALRLCDQLFTGVQIAIDQAEQKAPEIPPATMEIPATMRIPAKLPFSY